MPTPRTIGSPQTRIEQQAAKAYIAQVGSIERALDILQQIRDGKPTEDELHFQHVRAAMEWADKQMRPMPHRMPEILALYERHLQEKGPQPPQEQQPLEQQPLEQQPLEQQPLEQQPLEQQPLEQQPLEQQPLEQQPLELQPSLREAVSRKSKQLRSKRSCKGRS